MFKKLLVQLTSKSLLLSLAFVAVSCMPVNQDRPIEIRIVDLNGNPTQVKRFVPEGNVQAMARQQSGGGDSTAGASAVQEPISGEPVAQQLPAVAPYAPQNTTPQNNFANIANSVVTPDQNIANKEPETTISYDMSNDIQPVKNEAPVAPRLSPQVADPASAATKKFKFVSAASGASIAKAKSGNVSSKSVAKSATSKSLKGKFVQIGSFGSEEKANQVLNESSKISSGTIEEVSVGGKKTYRVLLGPVDGSSSKVEQVLSKIKNSGYKDAFIVK